MATIERQQEQVHIRLSHEETQTHWEQPKNNVIDALEALDRAVDPKGWERRQRKRARQAECKERERRLELERQAEIKRRKEHEKLVDAHVSYLKDQWLVYQKNYHDLPPELLPLEAEGELEAFQRFVAKQSTRVIERDAFDTFQANIRSRATEGTKALNGIRGALG
jgi:hypothetical protein